MATPVDELPGDELRAMARRYVERTLVPGLRDCPRGARRFARLYRALPRDQWNPHWPSRARVAAELGRLRAFLVAHVLPRLEHPAGFLVGEGVPVRVEEARPLRTDKKDVRVRGASPFFFTDATGEGFDLGDALYSREPALAVHGVILTLAHWPWTRCRRCGRVFAPGRYGAKYCTATCRGADVYMRHREALENKSPRERQAYKRQASERVKRIYSEKKQGTWHRQRAPGAGRPRVLAEKGD